MIRRLLIQTLLRIMPKQWNDISCKGFRNRFALLSWRLISRWGSQAAPILIDYLKSDNFTPINEDWALAILRNVKDEKAIPFLVLKIKNMKKTDKTYKLFRSTYFSFINTIGGEPANEAFINMLKNSEEWVKEEIASIINPEISPEFEARLAEIVKPSIPANWTKKIIKKIGKHGTEQAKDLLWQCLTKKIWEANDALYNVDWLDDRWIPLLKERYNYTCISRIKSSLSIITLLKDGKFDIISEMSKDEIFPIDNNALNEFCTKLEKFWELGSDIRSAKMLLDIFNRFIPNQQSVSGSSLFALNILEKWTTRPYEEILPYLSPISEVLDGDQLLKLEKSLKFEGELNDILTHVYKGDINTIYWCSKHLIVLSKHREHSSDMFGWENVAIFKSSNDKYGSCSLNYNRGFFEGLEGFFSEYSWERDSDRPWLTNFDRFSL